MKLGEALSLRARQAQKLDDLRGRIRANAMVQEDEEAAESANDLIIEFAAVSAEHATLLSRIARTNLSVETADGTLTATLHKREHLRRQRNLAQLAADAATPNRNDYRYMRSEMAFKAQVNVQSLRGQIEKLDDEVREVDAEVQEINWKTELL